MPPRLNEFGLAFQANHFNWPGSKPPPRNDHVARFPVSGMATYSYENNRTDRTSQANFRALELFLTDGYRTSEQQSGGFFVNAIAVTTEKGVRDWGLDNAFVSLPVAGRRGQWALTLGQFTPLMFQWDPVNSLTESLPAAMADDLNGFSLAQATPGIRLDFFDNRGKLTAGQTVGADRQGGMSGMGKPGAAGMGGMGKSGAAGMGGMGKPGAAGMGGMGAPNAGGMEMAEMEYKGAADGNYLSIGVPFNGALALNRDAKLGGAQGAYLHGFRRWGFTTLGFFGYTRTGSNLEGLVGTREVRKDLTILAAASTGHDDQGSTHRLSMQADYVISHQLSVSGRLEVLGGQRSDVAPVLSATYYPYEKPWMWLRVTGEMVQRKGDRTLSLLVRALF